MPVKRGDIVLLPVPDTSGKRGKVAAIWSGTSFAAPRVAAELAVLIHKGHSAGEAWSVVSRHTHFGN